MNIYIYHTDTFVIQLLIGKTFFIIFIFYAPSSSIFISPFLLIYLRVNKIEYSDFDFWTIQCKHAVL